MDSDVIFQIAVTLNRFDPVDRLCLHRSIVLDQHTVFIAGHLSDQLVIFLKSKIQPYNPNSQMNKRRQIVGFRMQLIHDPSIDIHMQRQAHLPAFADQPLKRCL